MNFKKNLLPKRPVGEKVRLRNTVLCVLGPYRGNTRQNGYYLSLKDSFEPTLHSL